MILTDNILVLKQDYPGLLKWMEAYQRPHDSPFAVEASKSGVPTLSYTAGGSKVYIHSKFNPEEEAERLISKYLNQDNVQHVLFYGVGLGYHIEKFAQEKPDVKFSIYEPNPEVIYRLLSTRSIEKLQKSLKHIYVEFNQNDTVKHIQHFLNYIDKGITVITLPAYERLFQESLGRFTEQFTEILKESKSKLYTNAAYEKRWIINSAANLRYTLSTPNIIAQKKQYFENKPAIIVGAGPSLYDDIEHLKYISENKLAYIIATGSGINALLSNGVVPDLFCSYDPSHLNKKVIEKFVEYGNDTIPFLFGSTIAYDSLPLYKGPKLHMLINQDTVTQYYVKRDGETLEVFNDAPSIAVVVLQLLARMGCNPIILSGINLAYRDNRLYAQGIMYEHRTSEVTEREKESAIAVEDVYGNQTSTNDGMNRMRQQMEAYIQVIRHMEVINTTKGGAKIQGTTFANIEDLIRSRLREPVVTETNWFESTEPPYDLQYVKSQHLAMSKEYEQFGVLTSQLVRNMNEMRGLVTARNTRSLEQAYQKFDKTVKQWLKNKLFEVFFQPMNRVQLEILQRNIESMRFQKDPKKKVDQIIESFGKVIMQIEQDLNIVKLLLQNIYGLIEEMEQEQKQPVAE
ncbi:motility associated factor glycosyltransferase family protein [Paenibacillus thermotolerans]|uniref:motility associated factor glycosyltransferase family protein n=1 Tax=Paenibacillus thermotolerans TaxID=3027807 RepID=UPI00236832CA|nr:MULTISPECIES: 6-hydroxymethylpterin diphosphokinase MptE-like protein [unclassified Paenibacillus]